MVAVLRARQGPSVTVSPSPLVVPAPSSSTLSGNGSTPSNAGISQGALVGAVLIPIILVVTLMLLFLVCKRRRRTTGRRRATPTMPPTLPVSATAQTPTSRTTMQRLDDWFYATLQMFTSPSNSHSTSVGGAISGNPQTSNASRSNNSDVNNGSSNNNNNNHNNRRNNRRGRRERLRRTDSGGTVKTLPEYNELGEDEIMLYKAADSSSDLLNEVSVQDAEDGRGAEVETESRSANDNNRHGRSPSRNSGRQSSLGTVAGVLRRLSQRRSDSNGAEGNEMTEVVPEEDAPEYSNLYPTLPPQIEVDEEAEEGEEGRQQGDAPAHPPTSRRRAALNSIFRRPAGERQASRQVSEAHHRRIVSAANVPSANEWDLTMTRSNDLSLYRPSTSTSRRVFGSGFLNNGSSASLLSLTQNSNEATESPGRSSLNLNQNRQQHIRNISAPISTRRLQFAPPLSGFSDQQMQFLTSVESLDRYGIPVEQETDVLPSFEQLARDEERRTQANVAVNLHPAPVLTTAEVHREESQMSPNASLPLARPSSTSHPGSSPSLPYVS